MIQNLNIPVLSFIDDFSKEVQSIGDKLIPNFWSFLVQFLSLIVLILIVMKFAYKPVKKVLKERADYVEKNVKEAGEKNAISEQNIKQSEEMIIASKKQANEIIESANKMAEDNKEAVILETEKQVMRMKKEAEEDIEKSKAAALDEIHDEMVNVAILASEEVLKREVSKEDDSHIVEEFIKNLD